jgi:inosine-uridine preferring nucleoside hydrolase
MSLPIIVDCDPGNGIPGANVDDALALLFALRHPELDCRAVWTVFGNTPSDTGAKCAQEIVDRAALSGQTPPRIRQGSTHPLRASTQRWDRQRKEYASSPEGVFAWGDGRFVPVSGDGNSSIDEAVAEKLFRDVADVASAGAPTVAEQKVTIVAIGPLTNIARMLVAHPEWSELLEQIVLMGGCFGFGDLVDTNFAVDPEAARIVFDSAIPLTIVPLDTTRTTHMSEDRWDRMLKACEERDLADALRQWISPWLAFSQQTRPVDGMWVHDLVTLFALTNPELVTIEDAHCAVNEAGKLMRRSDGRLANVVTAVDNEGLLGALEQVIAARN